MCDCANRIVSTGRNVGARTGMPAGMPTGMPDPNCPTCRVGAFAAGDARPPMPMGQVMPAGQSFTRSAPGQTWFTGMGVRFLQLYGYSCDRFAGLSKASQMSFLFGKFSGIGSFNVSQWSTSDTAFFYSFYNSVGMVFPLLKRNVSGINDTAAFEYQLSQLLQLILNDCLRQAIHISSTPQPTGIVRTTGVRPSGQSIAASPPGQTWFTTLGVQWLAANKSSCATWSTASRAVKLQILTDFFLSPNRFASSQYNLWFRATILRIFPALANRSGITLFAQQLSQLVDLINQDCTLAMMPRTAYSPGIFRSGF